MKPACINCFYYCQDVFRITGKDYDYSRSFCGLHGCSEIINPYEVQTVDLLNGGRNKRNKTKGTIIMSKESSAGSSAISIATLLTVAFVVLKLCKVIDWSWWLVVSPILIELGLAIIILTIYYVVLWAVERRSKKRIERFIQERQKKEEA